MLVRPKLEQIVDFHVIAGSITLLEARFVGFHVNCETASYNWSEAGEIDISSRFFSLSLASRFSPTETRCRDTRQDESPPLFRNPASPQPRGRITKLHLGLSFSHSLSLSLSVPWFCRPPPLPGVEN